MQRCDAIKFLRIAAVPVISLIIGLPAFVSAQAQANPLLPRRTCSPPGPVADLYCAGPKCLCRCACRMESRRSLANKYRIDRATRRGDQPWTRDYRAQRYFSIGTDGTRRLEYVDAVLGKAY